MKTIFQFYQGSMSDETKAAINDLKTKAAEKGWKHELYDLDRLLNEISDDNLHWDDKHRALDLKESIKRMWKYLPLSMAASATSDLFRYWVLQNGGMYCDDDVFVTTDEFPDLPEEDGVFTCSEQTAIHNLNTCVTIANGIAGATYSRTMTYISACRLKAAWLDSFEQCKANAKFLKEHPFSLISFIGPALVRAQLKSFAVNGIIIQRMPYELCSSHDPKSKLWHGGKGTWCFGGVGNKNNLYEKVKKSSTDNEKI